MRDVHDRGTMKWVSLMLPEHVELLKGVFVEHKQKPLLDEQKMLEIDQRLKYGLRHKMELVMTYYNDGDFLTLEGKIDRIDQWKGYIMLANENGTQIPLTDLIDVDIIPPTQ
jgi:ATP-dependent helicase/DNAse subunit B